MEGNTELTMDITTWRILIVDDEPDNLNLASDFLEFSGAKTAKAKDGEVGLQMVETFKPNMVLLDLGMPRIDGWEMHRRLRARPELNAMPIVALTAAAMPSDADKVRAAGFDAYITKPFRVKTLLDALTECVKAFTTRPDSIEVSAPISVSAVAKPANGASGASIENVPEVTAKTASQGSQ